jgi:hypothetical protein
VFVDADPGILAAALEHAPTHAPASGLRQEVARPAGKIRWVIAVLP